MEALIQERFSRSTDTSVTELSQLKRLILDGYKIKQFSPSDSQYITTTLPNLKSLSCSRCSLMSFENFPKIPTLMSLEAQDNSIANASNLEILGEVTPNLKVLRLGGNKIRDLALFVQSISSLRQLEVIDLEMNPVALTHPGYKAQLFSSIPSLTRVDGWDRQGEECFESEDDSSSGGEEDEEEDADDMEMDKDLSLKAFYEKDFNSEDEEDDEVFDPSKEGNIDDEDDDVDDDDDDDEEAEDAGAEVVNNPKK